jgi:FkbM family methyltransferase
LNKSLRKIAVNIKWFIIDDLIANLVKILILGVPQFFRVRALEKLNSVGRLDYKQEEILMDLQSVSQYSRLSSCRKEPGTVRFFSEDLREGDVVYDIGANVGAYSLIAASKGIKGLKVFAFEPSPATYAALINNIRINKFSDVIYGFPLAFGPTSKIDVFNQSNISPGAAEHALGDAIDFRGNSFNPVFKHSVLSFNIDAFINFFNAPFPTHIKIDVDGVELEILRGALQTFAKKSLRKVSIEVREGSSEEPEILSLMSSMGFETEIGDKLVNSGCVNYIFSRSKVK